METYLDKEPEKKGINKVFIGALIFGLAVVGVGIWLLSLQPSREETMAAILNGSYREGTPEFDVLTKDIIISTDPKTIESPTAFGTIMMAIHGNIRNKGTKMINGLEVNVGVIDPYNKVLKEKRVMVVPVQQPQLGPGQTIPVTTTLDGFSRDDDRANVRWKVTAIRVAE